MLGVALDEMGDEFGDCGRVVSGLHEILQKRPMLVDKQQFERRV